MPLLIAFGESFSVHGRFFIISGNSGTNWSKQDLGFELVNDATEWVIRNDLARSGTRRPGFIYNDKESRWLTTCKWAGMLEGNSNHFNKKI